MSDYVKNVWVDQDVERPRTYQMTQNQDGSVTLVDDFGLVTELGTPVDEVNMNHIEEGIFSRADKDLDYLTAKGEKHFVNKMQITNCILEAPNGVATTNMADFSVTVKAGLKVLMPNGHNTDGSMKNIEYTVPSDYTVASTNDNVGGLVCIDRNNNVIGLHYAGFNVGLDANKPSTTWNPQGDNEVYYATDTNKFYVSINNGTGTNIWTETPLAIIGKIHFERSNNIFELIPYEPINILKRNDDVMITHWAFPSARGRNIALGTSGTEYVAPADGWYYLNKGASAGQAIALQNNTASLMTRATTSYATALAIYIPVSKGDTVTVLYNATGTGNTIRFVYANGEK